MLDAEIAGLRKRCKAMLEQALSGSKHGDVRFVLGDGSSPLSGHRAVLCHSAVSEEYASMFRSGMVEEKEGKIRVPPGVSVEGYRGLLEWVYLGEDHCEIGLFHVCPAGDDGSLPLGLCACLFCACVRA